MAERELDVVVIGAGPAGEVVAGRLAEAGLGVALVERHLIGGECSYYACMPSKALLRPGELVREAGRVPGVRVDGLDVAEVLRRRDEVIHELDDATMLPWLEDRGIELVRGVGRLDGPRRVRVGADVLRARRAVVVATGSVAVVPPVTGLAESGYWTNREATTAREAPRRLVVLGGGVVGVELAQAWSSLGSEVAVVEAAGRLVSGEEPFASAQIETSLREQGVDVRLGAAAVAVERDAAGVAVKLEDGSTVAGDHLLLAVGRRPATEEVGVETVGLDAGAPIEVDDSLRSVVHDWLWAVGDVNGRTMLTHMGKYQARIAADAILGRPARLRSDGTLAPRVVFTDPQIAAVGSTLAAALEAGVRARAVDVETSGNAGGSFVGRRAPGTSRLVVDEERGVVVGATLTGAEVAESLHAATIAVVAELPLETLWHAVPVFPTRSELWLRLLEAYGL